MYSPEALGWVVGVSLLVGGCIAIGYAITDAIIALIQRRRGGV